MPDLDVQNSARLYSLIVFVVLSWRGHEELVVFAITADGGATFEDIYKDSQVAPLPLQHLGDLLHVH
jgi:hypothetical protein